MAIERIAVVGGGYMGGGIAQVAAQAGLSVVLIDTNQDQLAAARERIAWSLDKLADKGLLTEDPDTVSARLTTGSDLASAHDVDLVIEAVYEDVNLKEDLLGKLDKVCDNRTILGSNTSTIPITTLAAATGRPDRVIGIHFFGPVPIVPLVEVVRGADTSSETLEQVIAFVERLQKDPVVVSKDIPGFLMNRIFGVMACEAIRLVEDCAGTVDDIDQGMCDGFNMRVGPLAICDNAGLDICLNAFTIMHDRDPERMPKPPSLLKRFVAEGKLGQKTAEGFYRYDTAGKRLGPSI